MIAAPIRGDICGASMALKAARHRFVQVVLVKRIGLGQRLQLNTDR
jgi:hypothetical protein